LWPQSAFLVAGKLVENRRHLEAARLLADYANVCINCVFFCFLLLIMSFIFFVDCFISLLQLHIPIDLQTRWFDGFCLSDNPYVTKLTRSTQPCIPRGLLNRVPALIGCGKGGNVTSARWQVTLCDPIWHVSSNNGETCELLYPAVLFYFMLSHWGVYFFSDCVSWCQTEIWHPFFDCRLVHIFVMVGEARLLFLATDVNNFSRCVLFRIARRRLLRWFLEVNGTRR